MGIRTKITLSLQQLLALLTFGLLRTPVLDRLLPRLRAELDRNVAALGRVTYGANRVEVILSPSDMEAIEDLLDPLTSAIEEEVRARAADKGWTLLADRVDVALHADEKLRGGDFRLKLAIIGADKALPPHRGSDTNIDLPRPRRPQRAAQTVAVRAGGEDGRTVPILALFQVVAGPCGDLALSLCVAEGVLGRGSGVDLCLEADTSISRRHARLRCEPDGVRVEDLDSRTGLVLNGRPIRTAVMRPGDRLDVGETQLELVHAPGARV